MAKRVYCEVTRVDGKTRCCRVGDRHEFGIGACPPMCCKLFHAIFPAVSQVLNEQRDRPVRVTCPDGLVEVEVGRLAQPAVAAGI